MDGGMSIRVTVKLFARLREAVGADRLERQVSAGTTVGDLLADLRAEFPALAEAAPRTIVALNRAFAAPDSRR